MMSSHEGTGTCHMECCGGPYPDTCGCWMCRPDDFPWDKYPTAEAGYADWGRWYDGKPLPPEPEPDPDEQARYARAMSSWYSKSGRTVVKRGPR